MDHQVIAAFLAPVLLAVREVWQARRKPKDSFAIAVLQPPLLLTHERRESDAGPGSDAR